MPPSVAARTDNDIRDDAAGAQRVQLAQESKARREQEMLDLRARNAQQALRNANTGLRTDVNIEDEAAGIARVELAAASKARREETARRMARRNAEMRARNAETDLRTDANIEDEAAGAARVKMAAESKERRAMEARELAHRNAQMRQRLKAMRSRTDTRTGNADLDASSMQQTEDEKQRRSAAEEEAAELLQLRSMLATETPQQRLRRLGHKDPSRGWDSSPHKPIPYSLRGLKPVYSADPWTRTALESWSRLEMRPSSSYATAGLTKLDDGSRDDIVALRQRKMAEDRAAIAGTKHQKPWDESQWKYVPPSLRGLRPVTNEPWARDADVNEGLELMQNLDA